MNSEISFCGLEVKNNDYYRYICCLFTPQIFREKLFSLYAFNNEIAKIKDITSEQMTGLIRITWWQEAIEEIYSNKRLRNHEIVKPLAELIKSTNLPREYFEKMLDSRHADIGMAEISNMDDLNNYLDGTSAVLLKASLHITQVDNEQAFKAAGHIGIAYGLIGIMRRAKWDAAKRQIMFPKDMLNKFSLTEDDISEGRHQDKTREMVKELCDLAQTHLQSAHQLRKNFTAQALPIYLHGIIAKCFLKNIKKHKYDIFNSNLEVPKVSMLLKIFFAASFK